MPSTTCPTRALRNRFFSFWLMAYGVVLGVAYSEDFLSLYLF
jgi:multicomponent Na+:H+ antiporter subunit D